MELRPQAAATTWLEPRADTPTSPAEEERAAELCSHVEEAEEASVSVPEPEV